MSITKVGVSTYLFAAEIAAGQDRSRRLLQYCYDDYSYTYKTSGTYDSAYDTYTWQDENCPTSYDSYYQKTYICDPTD